VGKQRATVRDPARPIDARHERLGFLRASAPTSRVWFRARHRAFVVVFTRARWRRAHATETLSVRTAFIRNRRILRPLASVTNVVAPRSLLLPLANAHFRTGKPVVARGETSGLVRVSNWSGPEASDFERLDGHATAPGLR